jgi:hypothetical protein
MYDVGEHGKFLSFFYACFFPVIGEFISGLLPCHALPYPFFTTAKFLPVFPGSVNTLAGVSYFLHPFVAYFSQPLFEGLCFRRGDGLDDTEERFRVGDICEIIFPSAEGNFSWLHFVTTSLPCHLI